MGIFVTDRAGNVLTQVSGDTNSVTNSVWTPEINADGRLITFHSAATELTVTHWDALGHTTSQSASAILAATIRSTSTTAVSNSLQMVSVATDGTPGNGSSGAISEQGGDDWPASISADGRYVVFQSDASNLVAGDGNGASDIFVRDLLTGTTQRISLDEVHTGNYAAQGTFQVNTTTTGDQQQSSVTALADGGYLVAWDVAGGGVFAQRYDVNNHTVGGQFHVNTDPTNGQAAPSAAGLEGGGLVVVWTSASGEIHGQLYNSLGEAVRGEFLVNTETVNSESQPAVIAASDGTFFVTWTSTSPGGDADIHLQRYDATGATVGSEVTVNAALAGNQVDPAITALPDGGFVMAWTSPTLVPGANPAIFMQRFDGAGAPVSDAVQVDSTHTGSQSHASIALAAGRRVRRGLDRGGRRRRQRRRRL